MFLAQIYDPEKLRKDGGIMKLKASFTVENSVIIPLFVMIVVLLLYCGFLIHDSVVIKATMLKIWTEAESSEEVKVDNLVTMGEDYIKAKCICVKSVHLDIQESQSGYVFTCEFYTTRLSTNHFLQYEKEYDKNRPSAFIRKINAAERIFD